MMNRNLVAGKLVGFYLLASSTGCGGSGNSGAPVPPPAPTLSPSAGACQSFKEANATIKTRVDNTTTSSVSNPNNAIDGSLTTSATLVVNGSIAATQGVSIQAVAQSGIVFPSGKFAGAFYSVPSGTAQSYTVVVRTLLSGTVQESNSGDNSGGGSGVSGGHGSSFTGIKTTKPFDSVEVFVSNTQSEPSPKFEVFEICSDHS